MYGARGVVASRNRQPEDASALVLVSYRPLASVRGRLLLQGI